MIEDQVMPKKCGHFDGKQVIPRDEARMKIRVAVEAACEADILVLARTDARSIEGLEGAINRCRDFEEEGADVVFLEAAASREELVAFARAMRKPTMANLVAGGKTPMLSQAELREIGIRLVTYHPLLPAVVSARQASLSALRADDSTLTPHGQLGCHQVHRGHGRISAARISLLAGVCHYFADLEREP
jgi:2-methylisocitrate lyase-like PEP mutase family enzyme